MICIKTDIPKKICEIDDELKAIYHSKNSVCIWLFKSRLDRNKFMDETTVSYTHLTLPTKRIV